MPAFINNANPDFIKHIELTKKLFQREIDIAIMHCKENDKIFSSRIISNVSLEKMATVYQDLAQNNFFGLAVKNKPDTMGH